MKLRTLSICTAMGLLALSSQAHAAASLCDAVSANLVTNCGFETGDFTGWSLSGYDVTAGTLGNIYGVEGQDPDGTNPHSGSYQAYFGNTPGNPLTLSQTIATVAGKTYGITLYLANDAAPDSNGTNFLTVAFGGATVGSYTQIAEEDYTLFSFAGVASSNSSLFSVTLGNGNGYFQLDDAAVTAVVPPATVPEPSTLALTALAALGLGVKRRQRK